MGVRRVLMFCPQFRPIVGGAERQAEKLSRALVRRGIEVKVVTPMLTPNVVDCEECDGLRIYRFPLFDLCRRFPGIRNVGPVNLLLIRSQVFAAMSKHLGGVDLVHLHIAAPLTAFAMQAARSVRVPTICKVATAGDKTDLGELSQIGFGGGILRRSMVRHLDRWIATTEAVREALLQWNVSGDRIVCIPNGVDIVPAEAQKKIPIVARRFLYLGRISLNSQRDMVTLLDSFDRLCEKYPDAELALVGDGDLFQKTAVLVRGARHGSRIKMPGVRAPDDWLKWADCFVLPSVKEGLSNALLEAMAHGIPCIANDIPANREVLDDGAAGMLVPVGNVEALADAMCMLATVPNAAAEFGRSGNSRVREAYSIESVADRYSHLYEELLKGYEFCGDNHNGIDG